MLHKVLHYDARIYIILFTNGSKDIFNGPIEDIFASIGKKYDVDSSVIMQNFMKHWSAGLDYHLVLRMRELSPFEMGLVATFVSPIIEKNKSMSNKLN